MERDVKALNEARRQELNRRLEAYAEQIQANRKARRARTITIPLRRTR